jgi:hypothetical protein
VVFEIWKIKIHWVEAISKIHFFRILALGGVNRIICVRAEVRYKYSKGELSRLLDDGLHSKIQMLYTVWCTHHKNLPVTDCTVEIQNLYRRTSRLLGPKFESSYSIAREIIFFLKTFLIVSHFEWYQFLLKLNALNDTSR